jgi:hypothetical protein
MCVILIAEETRLDASTIEAAVEANPDGNGFAWMQSGKVHWRKGITVKAAIKLAKTKPLPYVFHARIATVGATCAALCHPFPITHRGNQTAIAGTSKRGVVFHNGSWAEWNEYVSKHHGANWSDSRGMADMVFADGDEALELIPTTQRVVMMTPTEILFQGTGWTTINGVKASNNHFTWAKSRSEALPEIDWRIDRSYEADEDITNQLDLRLRMANRNYHRWSGTSPAVPTKKRVMPRVNPTGPSEIENRGRGLYMNGARLLNLDRPRRS